MATLKELRAWDTSWRQQECRIRAARDVWTHIYPVRRDDERNGGLTSILQCDERKDERVQVHSFWFVVLQEVLLSGIIDRDLPEIHSLRHQDRTNLTGCPQRLTSIALEGRLLPGLATSNLIWKQQWKVRTPELCSHDDNICRGRQYDET